MILQQTKRFMLLNLLCLSHLLTKLKMLNNGATYPKVFDGPFVLITMLENDDTNFETIDGLN